jgi:hypothetical protein
MNIIECCLEVFAQKMDGKDFRRYVLRNAPRRPRYFFADFLSDFFPGFFFAP